MLPLSVNNDTAMSMAWSLHWRHAGPPHKPNPSPMAPRYPVNSYNRPLAAGIYCPFLLPVMSPEARVPSWPMPKLLDDPARQ